MWSSSLIYLSLIPFPPSPCHPAKGKKEEEEEVRLPNANLSPHAYIFITLISSHHRHAHLICLSYAHWSSFFLLPPSIPFPPPLLPFVAFIVLSHACVFLAFAQGCVSTKKHVFCEGDWVELRLWAGSAVTIMVSGKKLWHKQGVKNVCEVVQILEKQLTLFICLLPLHRATF